MGTQGSTTRKVQPLQKAVWQHVLVSKIKAPSIPRHAFTPKKQVWLFANFKSIMFTAALSTSDNLEAI